MRNIDNEIKTWEEVLKREKSLYDLTISARGSTELCACNEAIRNMHTAQSNIDRLYKQKQKDELS